jgi:hypothetical protein
MDLQPPAGSRISIATDGADPTIIVPATSSLMRYLPGLFLLFWLGMWTIGFRDAASKVLAGNANSFLIFWLCGWTAGGIFAALSLYRIFRPSIPESLELKRNSVTYDSGIPPLEFNSSWRNRTPKASWDAIFPKRVRVDFDRRQLQSLRLRETESANRLTIDLDGARLDIASTASEVEREWLARYLARRYSLTTVLGNNAASPDGA